MIDYRDGRADDAAALATMFARCFTDTFGHLYRPADLAAFLSGVSSEGFANELADPAYHFRVALAEGEVIGFVKLGPASLPIEQPERTIELSQFYILDRWQGQGVAAILFDWALEEARRQHATAIDLTVFIDNHRARRFYQRYGFVEIGEYRFMVGEQADEDRIMRLTL